MKSKADNLLEQEIIRYMDAESESISIPPPPAAARKLVQKRKLRSRPISALFDSLAAFIHTPVKFYHLGLTVLVLTLGFFYFNDSERPGSETSLLFHENTAMAIVNNTISVHSSTMLTSIPTLVIRN